MLDNDIDRPFTYYATFLVGVIRIPLTIFRKTKRYRDFVFSLVKTFLPQVLDTLLDAVSEKTDDVVVALFNVLGSWVAGVKKSKQLTLEAQQGAIGPEGGN